MASQRGRFVSKQNSTNIMYEMVPRRAGKHWSGSRRDFIFAISQHQDKRRLRRCAAEELLTLRIAAFHHPGIVRCGYNSVFIRASKRSGGIQEKRSSSIFTVNYRRCGKRES